MLLCGILNLSVGSPRSIMNRNADIVLRPSFAELHATRNCSLHDFSSRRSHSECCPEVSFYLHVQLVSVIPRSANCDFLMELGQSSTSAILLSVS